MRDAQSADLNGKHFRVIPLPLREHACAPLWHGTLPNLDAEDLYDENQTVNHLGILPLHYRLLRRSRDFSIWFRRYGDLVLAGFDDAVCCNGVLGKTSGTCRNGIHTVPDMRPHLLFASVSATKRYGTT